MIGLITITAIMIPNHVFVLWLPNALHCNLRGMLYMSPLNTAFFAVISLPLAVISAIEYSVPAFTAALAAVTIGEKVDRHRWCAMATSFLVFL